MRLVDGGSRCAGRVEMKHQDEWRQLFSLSGWSMKTAAVVCRQLDCGSVVSTRLYDGDEYRPVWVFTPDCAGTESALRECGELNKGLQVSTVREVICSGNTNMLLHPPGEQAHTCFNICSDHYNK